MAERRNLRLALEMLSGGMNAPVPRRLQTQALAFHTSSLAWMAHEWFQGLGIGRKITDYVELDQVVLKVYVEKKLPKGKLKAGELIPKELKVPGASEKVITDVQAIGRIEKGTIAPQSLGMENTIRVRPAIPGFSLGHVAITAGTFGCLVRKRGGSKTVYILSNSHVLADEGLGTKGDEIVQPGIYDGGAAATDGIAELDDFVPFTFTNTGYPNLVDAAIAKVKSAASVTSAIRRSACPRGSAPSCAAACRSRRRGAPRITRSG